MQHIDIRPHTIAPVWPAAPLRPPPDQRVTAARVGLWEPAPVWQLAGVGIGDVALSFSAFAGELVHLRGGSPMARLRVLAMAAGFVPAASGSCHILGHDMLELDAAARRALRQQSIACVLGGDRLPTADAHAAAFEADPTALDCVAQPLLQQGVAREQALVRARRELDTLCAGDLADRPARSLPAGDARLVLLARAMVVRPRLLVLDQPETGLLPAALSAVRQALWSLAGSVDGRAGTCTVMTTANPRLMASADRVLDLDLDLAPGHGAVRRWHG